MASNGLSRRKHAGRPPPICKSKAKMPPIPRSSPPRTLHCASYISDPSRPLYDRQRRNLYWMEVDAFGVWYGKDQPPQTPGYAYFWPFHRPWHWHAEVNYYYDPTFMPYFFFFDCLMTWLEPFDSGWHQRTALPSNVEGGYRVTM